MAQLVQELVHKFVLCDQLWLTKLSKSKPKLATAFDQVKQARPLEVNHSSVIRLFNRLRPQVSLFALAFGVLLLLLLLPNKQLDSP